MVLGAPGARFFCGLFPILHVDCRAPFSCTVHTSDASEEAWGLVTSAWNSREIRQTCSVRKKTRFRRVNAIPARSHALGLAGDVAIPVVSDAVAAALPDYDEALSCSEQAHSFARVFVDNTLFGACHHPADILELEARASNQEMTRFCGVAASVNIHHLFLCEHCRDLVFRSFPRIILEIIGAKQLVRYTLNAHRSPSPSTLGAERTQPGRCAKKNQVADINAHFSTSSPAQVGDLSARDIFQDDRKTRRGCLKVGRQEQEHILRNDVLDESSTTFQFTDQ